MSLSAILRLEWYFYLEPGCSSIKPKEVTRVNSHIKYHRTGRIAHVGIRVMDLEHAKSFFGTGNRMTTSLIHLLESWHSFSAVFWQKFLRFKEHKNGKLWYSKTQRITILNILAYSLLCLCILLCLDENILGV